jgi:hypothetical protein
VVLFTEYVFRFMGVVGLMGVVVDSANGGKVCADSGF